MLKDWLWFKEIETTLKQINWWQRRRGVTDEDITQHCLYYYLYIKNICSKEGCTIICNTKSYQYFNMENQIYLPLLFLFKKLNVTRKKPNKISNAYMNEIPVLVQSSLLVKLVWHRGGLKHHNSIKPDIWWINNRLSYTGSK